MLEREISIDEIEVVVKSGKVIEDYPQDEPHPSRLILGWHGDRPLHVVAADDEETNITHVITAYQPNPNQWEDDFKRRKR